MLIYIFYICVFLFVFFFEKSVRYMINNYLFEQDLKMLLETNSTIDFMTFQKNRYQKSSRVLLLLLFYPLLNFNLFYGIFIVALSFHYYKKSYFEIKRRFNKDLSLVRYQFPIYLRQIQILLYTNNVLNALIISKEYAPEIIVSELNILIDSLSKNPNNIQAFKNFMSQFKISEVDRAMKLLYRTYIVDKDESSKQLTRMISSTTKWIRQERLERQENSIKSYEWLGIVPLFGVTVVFLVIMAALLNNLFGKGGSL